MSIPICQLDLAPKPAESPGRRTQLLADPDYEFIQRSFRELLPIGCAIEQHLSGVLTETLVHPGSLVRAQLAFGIMRALGKDREPSRRLAIAIEYFHTASLIFDDMPAMDDATVRRGHTCPHLTWGEAAATLGALALINQAYALLWDVIGGLPQERRTRASDLVRETLGVNGILNGQALDLNFADRNRSEDDVLEVAEGKTVTLIRLTTQLPAIAAGASDDEIERLEALSRCWGLAYQIVDDFKDTLMTREETGKSTARDEILQRPNLAMTAGTAGALERLDAMLATGRQIILGLGTRWALLSRLQQTLDDERTSVAARLRFRVCA